MRILIQRVSEAAVRVDGAIVGQTAGQGLLILVCAEEGDDVEEARMLARKTAALRIFTDPDGKMNLSVKDIGGSALAVSQFTLAARWRKGNRPGFSDAAHPDIAEPLFEDFVATLRAEGVPTETGRFGADMKVALINDGPVTLWLDSKDPR